MYLGFCFEFCKSSAFLWKLCICPMFFMIERFLVVSIKLFKCTFAGSVVYFFMVISKVCYDFCFIYYVRNLALVVKGAIRFIYTITFCCIYWASPRIHSKYGAMRTRSTSDANTFHAVDVRTLLRYFNTTVFQIDSYKLAEWLWRHKTISSNSRCFVSLIPEYNCSVSIYWSLFSINNYSVYITYIT